MSSAVAFRFLTAAHVTRLHARHVGRALPTQPSLLESAVSSPMNHKHYGQTNLFQLAGVLSEKIILDHSFQDGNKRTALCAADMFLKINGYQLQSTPMAKDDEELNKALADAHVMVATKQWAAEDLGDYYEGIAKPFTKDDEEVKQYQEQSVVY